MLAIALVVWWVARVAGEEDEDAPLSCPCGLGDKAWPTGAAGSLEDLKWLHIPKAGSSWAVTMVQTPRACAGVSSAGLAAAMRCVPRRPTRASPPQPRPLVGARADGGFFPAQRVRRPGAARQGGAPRPAVLPPAALGDTERGVRPGGGAAAGRPRPVAGRVAAGGERLRRDLSRPVGAPRVGSRRPAARAIHLRRGAVTKKAGVCPCVGRSSSTRAPSATSPAA